MRSSVSQTTAESSNSRVAQIGGKVRSDPESAAGGDADHVLGSAVMRTPDMLLQGRIIPERAG